MAEMKELVLAGGCFWGMQDLFRKLPGVTATRVGYAGGEAGTAAYKFVKGGSTGHAESLKVEYDPDAISYRQLLEFFFMIHDPTTANRQGNDIGTQYRSAIFIGSPEEEKDAKEIIAEVNASGKWPGPVVTQLLPAMPFFDAEEEHQDYLEKFPHGYTCHFIRPDWTL